ncbi:hypothetical protein GCM10011367_10900 [Marinicauda pacifica]|nr:hypothetical protein GCM10011367_10900 [Marinicauda pacifica]
MYGPVSSKAALSATAPPPRAPGLTAVVEYTDEAPSRYRERFEAGEVYRSLVSDGELE